MLHLLDFLWFKLIVVSFLVKMGMFIAINLPGKEKLNNSDFYTFFIFLFYQCSSQEPLNEGGFTKSGVGDVNVGLGSKE